MYSIAENTQIFLGEGQSLGFTADNQSLVTANPLKRSLALWDIRTATQVKEWEYPEWNTIWYSLDYANRVLAVRYGEQIEIWDTQTHKLQTSFTPPFQGNLKNSPAGNTIMGYSVSDFWVYDVGTAQIQVFPSQYSNLFFLPDEEAFVAIQGELITVWDIETATILAEWKIPSHPLLADPVRCLEDSVETGEFLGKTTELLQFLLPRYVREGKSYVTIAVGCTGGRHRSVAVAEALRQRLDDLDAVRLRVRHRDIAHE